MTVSGIIFFGDSVFAGTGASQRELGCAKLVKDSISIPVSLKSRNWNTSQDGLDRLEQDVIKQQLLSHVIILFGNNDCWLIDSGQPKINIEQFEENMRSIVDQVNSNKQIPILCTLQPIDFKRFSSIKSPELLTFRKDVSLNPEELQKQYSKSVFDLANDLGIYCLDLRTKLEASAEDVIAPDGIHPNDKGHRIIASSVISFLNNLDSALLEKQFGR